MSNEISPIITAGIDLMKRVNEGVLEILKTYNNKTIESHE
jgi:hypothetical protein